MIVAWALAMGILIATSGAPPIANAHAGYDRSSPPDGAVITRAPERVDVWFTQVLFRRNRANALEVHDDMGERVDANDLVLDKNDRSHLSVRLPTDLPAGRYSVVWRTLSAVDGDTAKGTFSFTIDPAASESTPPPATGESLSDTKNLPSIEVSKEASRSTISGAGSEDPWWVLGVAAALAASLVLGVRALRRPVTQPTMGGKTRDRYS